jgi:hypothetical protein
MKNSNVTIGNRTRDLLACSAVPERITHIKSNYNTRLLKDAPKVLDKAPTLLSPAGLKSVGALLETRRASPNRSVCLLCPVCTAKLDTVGFY